MRSIDHSNSLASCPSRGFRAGIFDVSISVAGELSLVVSWDFARRSAFVRVNGAQSKSFALRFPLYRGQHLSLPRFGPIQFFPAAISSCSRFPIMTVSSLVAIRVSIYHPITGFRTASQPSFTIPPLSGTTEEHSGVAIRGWRLAPTSTAGILPTPLYDPLKGGTACQCRRFSMARRPRRD